MAGAGYSYNAQRLRSRKIVGSVGTVYHYDLGGNLIAESDTAGVMRRSYVWADGQPLAQIDLESRSGRALPPRLPIARLPAQATAEALTFLHTDHLGTPRLATDPQGKVIWRWEGNAFGETLANEDVDGDGKLTTINLRFPGQYYDAESGLHYNWNRYYDPKVGRYITADPVSVGEHVQSTLDNLRSGGANGQMPIELNPYAFVANNPLKYIDPEGLACEYKGYDFGGWVIGSKMCRCIWECGCPDTKTTKYTYGRLTYIRGREPITSKYNACTCEDARTSFP